MTIPWVFIRFEIALKDRGPTKDKDFLRKNRKFQGKLRKALSEMMIVLCGLSSNLYLVASAVHTLSPFLVLDRAI